MTLPKLVADLAEDARQVLHLRAGAALIRAALVCCAVAVLLLLPVVNGFVVAVVAVGTVFAAALPDRIGAGPLLVACVLADAFGYGFDAGVPAGRTVAFALALYLLHEATSLAASVPLAASVSGDVVVRWLRGCLPGLLAAVLAAAVSELVGGAGGGALLDVVGMLGALLAVAAIALLVRRPGSP